jgi:hypothetical protein
MICQTSVQNHVQFYPLHFPIVCFSFSHRDIIEANLENLNIPGPVLLCRHLALSAPCRAVRVCSYLHSLVPRCWDPGLRQAIHHRPPSHQTSPLWPVQLQVGLHLRGSPLLPSARSTVPLVLAVSLEASGFSTARRGQVCSVGRYHAVWSWCCQPREQLEGGSVFKSGAHTWFAWICHTYRRTGPP